MILRITFRKIVQRSIISISPKSRNLGNVRRIFLFHTRELFSHPLAVRLIPVPLLTQFISLHENVLQIFLLFFAVTISGFFQFSQRNYNGIMIIVPGIFVRVAIFGFDA